MILIEEYILLTKEERQKHLDLTSPCDERGGNSKRFQGLLAHFLDTSIPSGHKTYLCHACHNGNCSNVRHLYWGTAVENVADAIANGRPKTYDVMIQKYGKIEADKRISIGAKLAGEAAKRKFTGVAKTEEHRRKLSEKATQQWIEWRRRNKRA